MVEQQLFRIHDIFSFFLQESTLIEVPHFKEIPTNMSPNLQERLNGVTEVLSRISKLVSEDLDRAVNMMVGQDRDGNTTLGAFPRPLVLRELQTRTLCWSRFSSRQEARSGCGSQSCSSVPVWREGRSQRL